VTAIETVGRASSDGSTNRPARRAAAAARLTTAPLASSTGSASSAGLVTSAGSVTSAGLVSSAGPVARPVAAGSWRKKLSAAALAVTVPAPDAGTACQTRIDVFAFHRSSDVLTVVHGRHVPSSASR
jgi:hypothetical protein